MHAAASDTPVDGASPATAPQIAVVLDTIALTLHLPAGLDHGAAIARLRAALPPGSELSSGSEPAQAR